MFPTTSIVLDKRIKRKDNTYAVKLRITSNRVQQYYPLSIHLSPEDWEKTQEINPKGDNKQLKLVFNITEQRAVEIIRRIIPFSFDAFNKEFNVEKSTLRVDVFSYFQNYINELIAEDRIGTASSYKDAMGSFKKYLADKRKSFLPFEQVNPEFLNSYEKWMITEGKSVTTVGIYCRSMRTILNLAIENGKLKLENYPFGKRKYQIPSCRNIKKAASKIDIKKIVEYIPKDENEAWGRDMWLFSYLCNGANIKDIAFLKDANMDQKTIQFLRSKTKRSTKQDQKNVLVMRMPKIDEIIERWGIPNRIADSYIFGFILETDTEVKKRSKIKDVTKRINKYMRRIGTALEIETDLVTYSARHSFSTMLKRSGASTEFISESLGHKDKKTTENYLDSFEDEMKLSFQEKLLQFN